MAQIIVKLDKDWQPYYVDKFIAQPNAGDTIQWQAVDGRFSITIQDTTLIFSSATPPPLNYKEKFIIDSAGVALSKVYTVRTDVSVGTEKRYEVFCLTNEDPADAPPRIIINPPSA